GHLVRRYLHAFPTRRSSDLYIKYLRGPEAVLEVNVNKATVSKALKLIQQEQFEKELFNEIEIRIKENLMDTFNRFKLTPEYKHLDRKSTRLNSSHVKISYAV